MRASVQAFLSVVLIDLSAEGLQRTVIPSEHTSEEGQQPKPRHTSGALVSRLCTR